MATTALRRYLQSLASNIAQQNIDQTSSLLSLRDVHLQTVVANIEFSDIDHYTGSYFHGTDADLAKEHLKAGITFLKQDLESCLQHQLAAVAAWRAHMNNEPDTNWSLRPLHVVTTDLRIIASRLDELVMQAGAKPYALEKAMSEITSCFRTLSSDKSSDANSNKKRGMIFLVNDLLCIAFKLNNFAFLKSIIRVMEGQKQQDKLYAMSHRVTFRYYMGRRAMFEADYKSADDHLTFALQHCHKSATRNKRLILIHLIPVNLLLGRLPSDAMLVNNNLTQFQSVTQAVRKGDLAAFNQALDEHQDFFVQWGIYLVLEKLKLLTYRNLFKRVHALLGSAQIKLPVLVTAMHASGETDVDQEEVECILANLIHQRFIKGYIAHKQQILVMSKKEPFPAIQKA